MESDNMKNQKLVIIRGLPGSGKSTIAKLFKDFVHLEADMYHMKNGVYCFDISKVKEAHEWCFNRTEKYLKAGKNVVVSNTFTQKWEYERYIKLAEELQIKANVIACQNNFGNIHNVPCEALKRMQERWED